MMKVIEPINDQFYQEGEEIVFDNPKNAKRKTILRIVGHRMHSVTNRIVFSAEYRKGTQKMVKTGTFSMPKLMKISPKALNEYIRKQVITESF